MTASDASSRQSALDRLTANAPFLARLAALNPADVTRFLADGPDAALTNVAPPPAGDDIMRTLRPWRGRLARLPGPGALLGGPDGGAPPALPLSGRAGVWGWGGPYRE